MNIDSVELKVLKAITNNYKACIDFIENGSTKLLNPDLWRFSQILVDYVSIYKTIPTQNVMTKRSKNDSLNRYIDSVFDQLQKIEYDDKELLFDLEELKNRYQLITIENLKTALEKPADLNNQINLIQKSINNIKEIKEKQVYAQNTLRDGIDNFIERFKYRKENPETSKGVNTGFTSLDFITSGLKTPEYVLCCGSSGSGKSTLLMSLSINMFMQSNSIENDKFFGNGNSVIYYSLEIPYEECFDKLISYISKIPLKNLKTTELTKEQQDTLNKTLRFIKNYPYEFVIVDIPKGATSSQMESIFSDFNDRNSEHKIKVVCVDYLGLVDSDDKGIDQDWLKQTAISEELYKFCRVHDLILLTGVQLNETQPNKQDSQMGVFRLSRSKAIINPSTLCLMLETKPEEQNYPTVNVHIIKNRRGPKGVFTLRKSFETCAFLNDTGFSEETQNDQDISTALEKFEIENEE